MIIYLKAELYDFAYLQQNAFDREDAYCPLKRQIVLFQLINVIFDTKFNLKTHDEAREFFISLQNDLKNTNFMPFESHIYKESLAKVREKIESHQL